MSGIARQSRAADTTAEYVWPFPAEYDGWMIVHRSLRLDMEDFQRATKALYHRLEKGVYYSLPEWQKKAYTQFFERMMKGIHHHHDNEELYIFPMITQRVQLPEKMTADHKTLIAALDSCHGLVKKLAAYPRPSEAMAILQQIMSEFAALQEDMLEHFEEEENIGLPALRKHFTHKEEQEVTNKFIRKMAWDDTAQVVRSLSDDELMQFARYEGIPSLVVHLIFKRNRARYERKYVRPLEDLIAGTQSRGTSTLFFGLF